MRLLSIATNLLTNYYRRSTPHYHHQLLLAFKASKGKGITTPSRQPNLNKTSYCLNCYCLPVGSTSVTQLWPEHGLHLAHRLHKECKFFLTLSFTQKSVKNSRHRKSRHSLHVWTNDLNRLKQQHFINTSEMHYNESQYAQKCKYSNTWFCLSVIFACSSKTSQEIFLWIQCYHYS